MLGSEQKSRMVVYSLIPLVSILGTCQSYWRHAEAFRSALECGQNVEQVAELASVYGADDLSTIDDGGASQATHVVTRKEESFFLWFDSQEGLLEFQQGRYTGLKELTLSVRRNLCTGAEYGSPHLEVHAPPEFRDAVATLDGERLSAIWTDSPWPATFEVGLDRLTYGPHTIRLEKDGREPIATGFEYRQTGFWPTVRTIRVEVPSGQSDS